MSKITRWDPFKELEEIQHRLAPLWGREAIARADDEEKILSAEWTPPVDIIENEKEYLVRAELPGVRKEDIKVTVKDNLLSISGERSFKNKEKDEKHHRIECSYGKFVRSFTLPEGADEQHITAEHRDGLLTVHLEKNPEKKPNKVDIKIE